MWLKVTICVCILLFGILIGYLSAQKYRQKRVFFAQFYEFNERYLNELTYSRRPLREFIKQFPSVGEFGEVLQNYLQNKPLLREREYLSEQETEGLNGYFSMLGRGDTQSQKGYFSARKEELSAQKQQTAQEAKARGALYLKLGVLFALAVIILIV